MKKAAFRVINPHAIGQFIPLTTPFTTTAPAVRVAAAHNNPHTIKDTLGWDRVSKMYRASRLSATVIAVGVMVCWLLGLSAAYALNLKPISSPTDNRTNSPIADPNTTYAHYTLKVEGYVMDEKFKAIAGVKVQLADCETQTDERGYFTIQDLQAQTPDQTEWQRLRLNHPQFITQTRSLELKGGESKVVRLIMFRKQPNFNLSAAKPGSVSVPGLRLDLPDSSLVFATGYNKGNKYYGAMQLSVHCFRPQDPFFGYKMPGGDFRAIDHTGREVMLYSYGVADVEMLTDKGEALQLAEGAQARLTFTLSKEQTAQTIQDQYATIPLWHYNPEVGLWFEDGEARQIQAGVYSGYVSHFSSWNLDVPKARATLQGKIQKCGRSSAEGTPVLVGQLTTWADAAGNYKLYVPAGTDLWVRTLNEEAGVLTTGKASITITALANGETRTAPALHADNLLAYAPLNREGELRVHTALGEAPLQYAVEGYSRWQYDPVFRGLNADADYVVKIKDAAGCTATIQAHKPDAACRCIITPNEKLMRREDFYRLKVAADMVRVGAQQDVHLFRLTPQEMQTVAKGIVPLLPCTQRLDLMGDPKNKNTLTTFPEDITALQDLQVLNISANRIATLPESIARLRNLEVLDLSHNRLTSLPADIAKLDKLHTLILSGNQLTTLPKEIGQLRNLRVLELEGNPITHLPESFGELSQLRELTIRSEKLTALPASFGKLQRLESAKITAPALKSLPADLTGLTSLTKLNLNAAGLTALTTEIAKLTALQELHLQLDGIRTLPEAIGYLPNLEELTLTAKQLVAIPNSLGELKNLRRLTIIADSIYTQLPETFGQLVNVESLTLDGYTGGELPESFYRCTALKRLTLRHSRISTISAAIEDLNKLLELEVSYTYRLQALPPEIGSLPHLRRLVLRDNRLQHLPAEIGRLGRLEELDLEYNTLRSLPEEMEYLLRLKKLNLKNCGLPQPKIRQVAENLPNCQVTY